MDFKRQVKNELENIFLDKNLYGKKVLISSIDSIAPTIKGTFVDPSDNRVFQFEITKEKSVNYKPNIAIQDLESDSSIINRLDAYSAGFSLVVRKDAEIKDRRDASHYKCSPNSYPCNGYCLELRKPCAIRNVDNDSLPKLIDFVFSTAKSNSNY